MRGNRTDRENDMFFFHGSFEIDLTRSVLNALFSGVGFALVNPFRSVRSFAVHAHTPVHGRVIFSNSFQPLISYPSDCVHAVETMRFAE